MHIKDNENISNNYKLKNIENFVGQNLIIKQITLLLQSAKIMKHNTDHILLWGPPGLGKTTLAHIIASETSSSLRICSGPSIKNTGHLAALLSSLNHKEILFLDEIHRITKPVEEMLSIAMESNKIDVILGKGVGANSISLDVPKFTLIGATTKIGFLSNPFRDRFGFIGHFDFYSTSELMKILENYAKSFNLILKKNSSLELASRSRGTPRIAKKLFRRVRDWFIVNNSINTNSSLINNIINKNIVKEALKIYEIDSQGLDKTDRIFLKILITKFNGGPVGISNLALTVGEDEKNLVNFIEPYLIKKGFLKRTSRGRIALSAARKHLNI